MNRGEQLTAGYKKTSLLPEEIRGRRKRLAPPPQKSGAIPGDIYYVDMPKLNSSQCIIPDTMVLSFKFENSNTKSWFLNNLGRLLVDQLSIVVQGELVYQNTSESMFEVYKDLWRSDDYRENRQSYGIANENVRKLISGYDSANKAAKTDGVLDVTIANMCDRMKIPLGKILCDHGPYAPYGMCDFSYKITFPNPEKIMKAQTNETIGNYKLADMKLEYDVIESNQLAEEVKGKFNLGRSLGYDHTTLLKILPWSKDSTMQSININIPRKSMKAAVLLFTKKDAEDSKEFVFPNLPGVNVTVEVDPNAVYSNGLAKRDIYGEADRFFGNNECGKYLGRRKYYTDKFACVIDFRTVDDHTVSGSGRKLVGTQAGILLQIEKETTTTDLTCHVFVVADGLINIMGTNLNGSAVY